NAARLRLMRLTEAAENLQSRAAMSIQVGKETEARELLIQKKKLMQALKKSKNRIEAISLKETQLIGQVAIQREDNISDSCGQIHFVSAKEDTVEVSKSKDSSILSEQSEHQDHDAGNYEDKLSGDSEQPTFLASVSSDMSNFVKMVDSSEGFHEHILENLDMQLKLLETDIENFLRSQSLKEETKQKQMNEKLEKLSEILKDVLSIRERIASMVETRVDDGN
ncbi:hypothetical protein MUK42_36458, partial [Musa troglodytarum]